MSCTAVVCSVVFFFFFVPPPSYSGWKAHSELASSSGQDRSSESAREVDTITWIGAFVNIGLAGFKVRFFSAGGGGEKER